MASACGSTLALMSAGVPIRKMVGGVACGLVTNEDGSFHVLVDMRDVEDFYGDMDFKITVQQMSYSSTDGYKNERIKYGYSKGNI
jgi:polyribonucleotide nucleotidyltransferase